MAGLRWLVGSVGAGSLLVGAATGCATAGRPSPGSQPAAQTEVVEERWPDGRVHVRREVIRASDGTLQNHGTYMSWLTSGQQDYEATYAQGQLDGVERQWHDNGQLRSEQHYSHGSRQGPRLDWDPEGRLRKEERYADDLPDGLWTIWDKDGRIKWQQRFERGQPVR